MKCSICGNEIETKGTWGQGNNAEPINDGRCCDYCDDTVVIPRRLIAMGYTESQANMIGQQLARARKERNENTTRNG